MMAVLFAKFFGAKIPGLNEQTEFVGMLAAYVVLVSGCLLRSTLTLRRARRTSIVALGVRMSVARTMLITGGSRGIGAATARMAAKAGYDVALTYASNEAAAAAVVRDIEAAGRRGLSVACKAESPDDIEAAFQAVDQSFGRLDAFFNNAGTLRAAGRPSIFRIATFQPDGDQCDRSVRCRAMRGAPHVDTARRQRRRDRQHVEHGHQDGRRVRIHRLCVSKAGMDTLTIGLAKELAGEGIRVNAVRPGMIHTEIHDLSGFRVAWKSTRISFR